MSDAKPEAAENVMLQAGIAALEHARDLRVKVGVSDLQAAALLAELTRLKSDLRGHAATVAMLERELRTARTNYEILTSYSDAQQNRIELMEKASEAQEGKLREARQNARRWERMKTMIRVFSLDMGGRHRYAPTMEFHKLRGPSIDAAMDSAPEPHHGE